MANRRQVHCARRRGRHAVLRETAVVRQENESSSEGPKDSKSALKAEGNLKSRKPLYLQFRKRSGKVGKGCSV